MRGPTEHRTPGRVRRPLALTLRHHGVTEFATRNEAHFTNFGFTRVWNPLPH